MTPGEVNDFVSWLRVESVVRGSRLTPEAVWKLTRYAPCVPLTSIPEPTDRPVNTI
jgi:hypothetical protein